MTYIYTHALTEGYNLLCDFCGACVFFLNKLKWILLLIMSPDWHKVCQTKQQQFISYTYAGPIFLLLLIKFPVFNYFLWTYIYTHILIYDNLIFYVVYAGPMFFTHINTINTFVRSFITYTEPIKYSYINMDFFFVISTGLILLFIY